MIFSENYKGVYREWINKQLQFMMLHVKQMFRWQQFLVLSMATPNVKPATRKKVLEVIERLDYRPNAVARGLASKKTTTVGVIIPDVSNMFFASLARGIDDIATMYKYNIILANSDGDNLKEVHVLNNLLAKQVDGIIFMGHHITDEIRGEFSRSKTPVVLAGSIDPDNQVGSVNIDYQAATKEAVQILVKNGHKRYCLC